MFLEGVSPQNKFSICLLASCIGLFIVTYECFSLYSVRTPSPHGGLLSLVKGHVKLPVINGVTKFTGAANVTLGVRRPHSTPFWRGH